MIAGLHWTAWLLLVVSVGLGLAIELRFYFSRKNRKSTNTEGGA